MQCIRGIAPHAFSIHSPTTATIPWARNFCNKHGNRLSRKRPIRENDHPGNDFPGNVFPGKKTSGKVTIREMTVNPL